MPPTISYPDVPYTCQRDHPAASLVTGTAETGGTRDCGRKVALARGGEMAGTGEDEWEESR